MSSSRSGPMDFQFSPVGRDSLAAALYCVASSRVRAQTSVSQLALAQRGRAQSALPSSCFRERIEFPCQLPRQSAIHGNPEADELEIRSIRANIWSPQVFPSRWISAQIHHSRDENLIRTNLIKQSEWKPWVLLLLVIQRSLS